MPRDIVVLALGETILKGFYLVVLQLFEELSRIVR